MYNFILQILIMLSLGAIIYLIARAAPRVGDIEESFKDTFHGKLDKLIAKIPLERFDVFFSVSIEKILRKIKLILMKCDNLLAIHLKKIKKSDNIGIKEEKQSLFVSSVEDKKEE